MSLSQTCRFTKREFEISSDEQAAYEQFELPLPDLCVEERFRRQLAFRSGQRLFWRSCAVSDERVLSSYSPGVPFNVVSREVWESGQVDNRDYGRAYDPTRPFFTQLYALWREVMRPAMWSVGSLRSQRVHESSFVSDCSMLWHSDHCSNCSYSVGLRSCDDCVDCLYVSKSEHCYECIDCRHSRRLRWCEHCDQCFDSWFLSNCRGCSNCLFCANLDGKEYHVFNRPVTVEEYEATIRGLGLDSRYQADVAKEQFYEFVAEQQRENPATDISQRFLYDCRDAVHSFCCDSSSSLMLASDLSRSHNCLDGCGVGSSVRDSAQFVAVGCQAERIVNCLECANQVSDLTYCIQCERSQHLLACVGLRDAEYCILNTQYSKEEYHALAKIARDVLSDAGHWGSFFTFAFSPYAYNHSAAQLAMPLNEKQAEFLQVLWEEEEDVVRPSALLDAEGSSPLEQIADVPITTAEFDGEQTANQVFLCELSGTPFQIGAHEIAEFRRLEVPPPARCFAQRHRERLVRLGAQRFKCC